MEGTGAVRATLFRKEVTVTVKDNCPDQETVFVFPEGTVQFVNEDSMAYRLRLYTRNQDGHADVDVLLPARCGITVMVDPRTEQEGQCYYELLPTTMYAGDDGEPDEPEVVRQAHLMMASAPAPDATAAAATSSGSGTVRPATSNTGGGSGGGTIKIGGH